VEPQIKEDSEIKALKLLVATRSTQWIGRELSQRDLEKFVEDHKEVGLRGPFRIENLPKNRAEMVFYNQPVRNDAGILSFVSLSPSP